MSNNNKNAEMLENKVMNRSSFLKSLGVLGALGTVPFLAASCNEKEEKPLVYEGENKDAIIHNIMSRRAIRKYKNREVSKEVLDIVLKCAVFAPSSLNKQPWEIRVVQNAQILEEINKRFVKYAEGKTLSGSAAKAQEKGFSVFHHAPNLIVIAIEKSNPTSKLDAGILLQNILLSAHALNLGTCPIGSLVPVLNLTDNQDILRLLNIPEGYEIGINTALGYPDESPVAPIRYSEKVKIIK